MVRVKICGITNLEDARVAAEAGADLLGFVFHPRSPRYVTPEQVREIVMRLRTHPPIPNIPVWPTDRQYPISNTRFVGVFVDQRPEIVAQTLDFCGLDYAQLHGGEPPEAVAELMDAGFEVIKALRVRDGASLAEMRRYRATAYLLDAYVPGRPGGTGQTFDWALAVRAKQYGPVILAGGLTADNVTQAVHQVRPWGVDVSSGVESTPGHKDHDKLRRFIAAAKAHQYPIPNI